MGNHHSLNLTPSALFSTALSYTDNNPLIIKEINNYDSNVESNSNNHLTKNTNCASTKNGTDNLDKNSSKLGDRLANDQTIRINKKINSQKSSSEAKPLSNARKIGRASCRERV